MERFGAILGTTESGRARKQPSAGGLSAGVPMTRRNYQRRQFLIDKQTQWRIARGLTTVWFVGGLAVAAFPVFATLAFGLFVQGHSAFELLVQISAALWFPTLMALLVAPLGIWWSIRFSNRIAGPIFRFNREVSRLLAGEPVPELRFRKYDFFKSLEGTFGALRERLMEPEYRRPELEKTSRELVETR
jgi:hypothetical protein